MRAILRVIDAISEWTGKAISWLAVALVMVIVYEVVMRYVFNSPTMWAYETSVMLGGTVYVMGWAYVHRHHGHVRVDVLYSRFSPRRKAIIDVICALLFLFPLLIVLLDASASFMRHAWSVNERLIVTYWMPPAAPFRTIVMIGLSLFALQSVAQFIRDLSLLIRNKPL